jgi:hypothetical protein
MHKGYNLKKFHFTDDKYLKLGESIFKIGSEKSKVVLSNFIGPSGKLDASKMTESWFPDIEANVFISHSHQDRDLAVALAGYLFEKFEITSFIDSMVWGHSDDLLKMIDNKYCRNENGTTYSYEKRNKSTAHVYMTLSVELSQMINRCECLIFINTPKSVNSSDVVSSTTESPWIYAEIAMTALIKARSLKQHRSQAVVEKLEAADSVSIEYSIDLGNLIDMDATAFNNWVKAVPRQESYIGLHSDYYPKCYRALDHLYSTVK